MAAHHELGPWPAGGYYDFLSLPDGRLLFLVADASDRGAPAATLVAMLSGRDTIRDVIAFPKTSSFTDLLTGAPDAVEDAQLKELHIRVVP